MRDEITRVSSIGVSVNSPGVVVDSPGVVINSPGVAVGIRYSNHQEWNLPWFWFQCLVALELVEEVVEGGAVEPFCPRVCVVVARSNFTNFDHVIGHVLSYKVVSQLKQSLSCSECYRDYRRSTLLPCCHTTPE